MVWWKQTVRCLEYGSKGNSVQAAHVGCATDALQGQCGLDYQDSDVAGRHLLYVLPDDCWVAATVGAFQRVEGRMHIARGLKLGAYTKARQTCLALCRACQLDACDLCSMRPSPVRWQRMQHEPSGYGLPCSEHCGGPLQ